MAGSSSLWKTIVLPPLFALILYLLTNYLLLPAYRHFRAHSNYTLVPTSPEAIPFARGLYSRLSDLLGHRQGSFSGVESLLGDEELEDDFGDVSHSMAGPGRTGRSARVADTEQSERRLSQDLERGFMDSSDEEEEDDSRRRSRQI